MNKTTYQLLSLAVSLLSGTLAGAGGRKRVITQGGSAMSEPGKQTSNGAGPDRGGPPAPETPAQLDRGSWFAAGKRAVREYGHDFLQDRAAALTYSGCWRSSPRCWSWSRCSADDRQVRSPTSSTVS